MKHKTGLSLTKARGRCTPGGALNPLNALSSADSVKEMKVMQARTGGVPQGGTPSLSAGVRDVEPVGGVAFLLTGFWFWYRRWH